MSIALNWQPPRPGIAVKESHKLNDLTSSAVAECRSAYEIIADASTYRFETTTIEFEDGTRNVGELVHIAYWSHSRYNIPVWAGLQNDNVSYYYGKPETGVKHLYAPFPHDRSSKISEHVVLFRFVAPSNWPSVHEMRIVSKTASRRRLALLVKFTFLLTNRIDQISNTYRSNLPMEFKNLCAVMQNIKDLGEGEPASRPEDEENNGVNDSMEVETSGETNKSSSGFVGSKSSTAGVPVKHFKRPAVTSVSDDEHVERNVRPKIEHGTYPPCPLP
jgi:hypothetical protein